jgi:hypothetical protein
MDVDELVREYEEHERQLQRRRDIGLQNAKKRAQQRVRERTQEKERRERDKQMELQEKAKYQKVRRQFLPPQDSDLSEDSASDSDPNLPPNPTRYITKNITPSREMIRQMIQEEYPEERDRVLQFRIQHLESEIQNLRSGYNIQIQKLHAQLQEFIQKYQLKYTVCKA